MSAIPQIKNGYIIRLFLLYLLSNLFLLLNFQGIYWDDWALVTQSSQTIKDIFDKNGFIFIAYLHLFLKKIGNGIYIYRLLMFFAYFSAGISLFYILQRIKYFDKKTAFYIALLFLLAPVNNARIALINTPVVLMLALFYFAFFLLTRYLDRDKNIANRVTILLLFFTSFILESLLVFYAIVLFYILYDLYQKDDQALIKNFIIRYFDFISLPVVFFLLKNLFFKPHGNYTNYNALNSDYSTTLKLTFESFASSFYSPIALAFVTAKAHLILTISFLIVTIVVLKKAPIYFKLNLRSVKQTNKLNASNTLILLLMGIILFVLAVFPYCAVGKLPETGNWNSRHQILVPLGMAFILYFFILFTAKIDKGIANALMYGIVAIFIVQGFVGYYLYQMDWFYQCSLLKQFESSDIFKNNTTFVVKDNLETDTWVNKGNLSVNWLLKNAFREDNRLMVKNSKALDYLKKQVMPPEHFASHWHYSPPVYLEFSKNINYQLTWNKKLGLFFDSIFNQKKFEEEVKNLTDIQVV